MKYYPENEDGKTYIVNTPRLIDSASRMETTGSLMHAGVMFAGEIAFQLKRIADTLVNFGINGVPVERVP